MNDTDTDNLPPPPPKPPRALTKKALRRSWAEPRVRTWLVLALAMLVIALIFTVGRAARSAKDYSLIKQDRKSTRLNSSHTVISYAVFCLKKKKKIITINNKL